MSYIINNSDGTPLVTIPDGGVDNTTSLTLPGPNYVGYGEALNENLVYLLENFASGNAPSGTSQQGQLWFNKSTQTLNVFTSIGYVPVSGISQSSSQPTTAKNGDIWFNTGTNQVYMYYNGTFDLIGPQYTKAQGVSGAIPITVNDANSSGVTHNIIQIQFGSTIYAIFNPDLTFTPSPAIVGFATINQGLSLNSTLLNPLLNSNLVGSVTGSVTGDVVGNVTATTLTGTLTGNVFGNVTATSVAATRITGALTGNVTSTLGQIINFSSSNILVSGGSVTGLATLGATSSTLTNLGTTTLVATNLSSGNIVVTGGYAHGLANVRATEVQATNFSTGNALITGGIANGLNTVSATTAQVTNLSSSNVVITGGYAQGLANVRATEVRATNLSSSNVVITGGYAQGLANVRATEIQTVNLSASNVLLTGGNVNSANINGGTAYSTNLINSTASTTELYNHSTAIATTQFVHTVIPVGIICMWGGSVISIPVGWQLCDGSYGTPDLRNMFIIGAGSTYSPGNTGGNASITLNTTNLPSHAHSFTATGNTNTAGGHTHAISDPGHNHAVPYNFPIYTIGGSSGPNNTFGSINNPVTTTASTGIGITAVGDHIHTLTLIGNVNATGSGQSFDPRPPYYALCYIQKQSPGG